VAVVVVGSGRGVFSSRSLQSYCSQGGGHSFCLTGGKRGEGGREGNGGEWEGERREETYG